MRFVIVGAGAIGGVVGGRLAEHGHDVLLVARGAPRRHRGGRAAGALAGREVRVRSRSSTTRPRSASPRATWWCSPSRARTRATVLEALSGAPPDTPVVCMQNGVDNERQVLRRFARTYAVPVMCPASHLEPGIVDVSSAPVAGILDIGCYPTGVDDLAEGVAAALSSSGFSSEAKPDVMRFKWSKLLMNLGNSLEAACGPIDRGSRIYRAARKEGRDGDRGGGHRLRVERRRTAPGAATSCDPADPRASRGGGSSWQSLARGTGTIEVDQLNGEIVLRGRLHGVATPVNELLQRVGHELASSGAPPGSMTVDELEARLPDGVLGDDS